MNNSEYKELRSEIGQKGLLELGRLTQWLNSKSFPPQGFQGLKEIYANQAKLFFVRSFRPNHIINKIEASIRELEFSNSPSLISRGVAEFFDVSIPRFSTRLYFETSASSLINIRRIGTFCDQVKNWIPQKQKESRRKIHKLSRFLRSGSAIGDSLIAPPGRFDASFHFVPMPSLAQSYGEQSEFTGLPYIKNIAIAGLCSQASCYMVTAILHKYARGAYGLTEITYLASEKENRKNRFRLYGLSQNVRVSYAASTHRSRDR